MATTTDELNTVIRLVGGAAYLNGLRTIAGGVETVTQQFADYETMSIRAGVALKNMGVSFPTADLQSFSRSLAYATGTTQTEVVQLEGYLARFGGNAETMKRASRDIIDASQLSGKGIMEIAAGLEEARRGHAREFFRDLGIQVKGFNGIIYDTNQILAIMEKHTQGTAAAFGGSMQRSINDVKVALNDLQVQAGQTLAPAAKYWLSGVTGLFASTAKAFAELNRGNWKGFFGFQDPATLGAGAGGAALSIGGSVGRSRSEDYLRRIEMNTGPQGALGRALRAGGSYAEPGAGMPIRDFQLALRHHR